MPASPVEAAAASNTKTTKQMFIGIAHTNKCDASFISAMQVKGSRAFVHALSLIYFGYMSYLDCTVRMLCIRVR